MSNLVEKLRRLAEHDWRVSFIAHLPDTAKEAADEINRLTAERNELRNTIAELYIERDTAQSQLDAAKAEIEETDKENETLMQRLEVAHLERDTAEARGYARGREEMREEAVKAVEYSPGDVLTWAQEEVIGEAVEAIRNLP